MHKSRRAAALPVGVTVGALVAGGLLAMSGAAQADTASDASDKRQEALLAAADEYHIPPAVLLALSHQESAWDGHGGLPSTDGGYGPMNLTDVTPAMLAGGGAGAAGRADVETLAADPALHTLRQAAELTGLSARDLREDDAANIRGGAALLASYERDLVGATPTDPGEWYGAVARYSQAKQEKAAASFADRVFRTMRGGASATTPDGQRLRLAAGPSVTPDRRQIDALHLKKASTAAAVECPATVDCTFVAGSPVGGQVADRPTNGIRIDTIVIHDLESTYDAGVAGLANPTNPASTHYVMSSSGAVTQMVPTKDIAFHAGNYSTNLHSIGIEHEGFAAHGAAWYTESQYQATADLVKYLAERFGVPLDRQHVIGHDNVAGPNSALVAGMHWDPGYAWDWNHFMSLLGAPVSGLPEVPQPGEVVAITPSFTENVQTFQVCPSDDPTGQTPTCTERQQQANFVYLRTAPDETAPLFGDQAIHGTAAGTDRVNDWGSTAQAGQQFVVAEVRGVVPQPGRHQHPCPVRCEDHQARREHAGGTLRLQLSRQGRVSGRSRRLHAGPAEHVLHPGRTGVRGHPGRLGHRRLLPVQRSGRHRREEDVHRAVQPPRRTRLRERCHRDHGDAPLGERRRLTVGTSPSSAAT
ncbi:N-acetylmuramoyl-L-alanine amidase [Streptomyces sp. ME03-5684b]|nr:N-acetylmuramoyl-L-alanine amidase [Streptomyces sp. ME03-5684b]